MTTDQGRSGPFRPTVYNNQRPLLIPADLGNHPRAEEYIKEYLNLTHYPVDFKTWLNRQEIVEHRKADADRQFIRSMAEHPYCANPRKLNRFR